MTELQRLGNLGWNAAPKAADGVRYYGNGPTGISYPRNVLDSMAEAGGDGFWLEARARAVARVCREARIRVLWDVGAGSGAMLKRLTRHGVEVISIEPLPEGAREIAQMGGESFSASLQDLQLPDSSLSAIGLFDVVEHIENPHDLLTEVARVLAPDGLLIVTVPAFQWLWSREDEALGHFRRYTRKSLVTELESANFQVTSCGYMFASLVLPAALLRAIPYRFARASRRQEREILTRNAARLNPSGLTGKAAAWVLGMEFRIGRFLAFPFGLSVLASAHPKKRRG